MVTRWHIPCDLSIRGSRPDSFGENQMEILYHIRVPHVR